MSSGQEREKFMRIRYLALLPLLAVLLTPLSRAQAPAFVITPANRTVTFSVKASVSTFDIPGNFTIRGESKPETLSLTVSGKGTGVGEIKGIMAFDRKDYGMNKGIPFVTIADRVEVDVDLHGKRVSGPPLVFKQ